MASDLNSCAPPTDGRRLERANAGISRCTAGSPAATDYYAVGRPHTAYRTSEPLDTVTQREAQIGLVSEAVTVRGVTLGHGSFE